MRRIQVMICLGLALLCRNLPVLAQRQPASANNLASAPKRPLTADDMLATSGNITVSASESGQVAVRASSQVWVIGSDGIARQIAERPNDPVGALVQMSPEGGYVAIATSSGASQGELGIQLIDLTTGRLGFTLNGPVRPYEGAWRWIRAGRLLYVRFPLDLADVLHGTQQQAIVQWARQRDGREPSVSVLHSGPGQAAERFGHAELHVVDTSGRDQTIASTKTYLDPYAPITAGPDNRWIAWQALTRPPGADPFYGIGMGYVDTTLTIVPSDGSQPAREVTGAYFQRGDTEDAPYYLSSTPKWSPDGSMLAVLGKAASAGGVLDRAYIIDPATAQATQATPPGRRAADVAWTSGKQLVEYGCREDPAFVQPRAVRERVLPPCLAGDGGSGRRDWWTVNRQKVGINLSRSFREAPREVRPGASGRNELLAVVDHALWQIPADGGMPTAVTDSGLTVSEILWPAPADAAGPATTLLLEGKKEGRSGWVEVKFDGSGVARTEWIANPTAEGRFAAYSPGTGVVVKADEDAGTFIWIAKSNSARQALALNQHLASIQWPKQMEIPYLSQEGKKLVETVILPTSYVQGRRYPLVLEVYPGGNDCQYAGHHTNYFQNVQLLAAKDYVVACPQMPVPHWAEPANWRAELPKGVFGAIDKLIDVGIADPDRVALMGHSFGGFATLSLVTMTDRFKAALAMAPISDFLSDYGSFNVTQRYFDGAHEIMRAPLTNEMGQSSMAQPPWENLQQYIQNSPIVYVNRVNTPVMLVQGDMDNLSIHQSEEFFTGLYRQSKRAEFVRYWGEAHGILSPANVRDLWRRIYAWFDEFCDISRDSSGNLIFDGDHVKSRNGAPPLKPEDFAHFDELTRKAAASGK